MANNAFNYLESGIYNHLLRASTFSKPTNICVALTTNNPQDNEQNVYSEVANAGGYARVPGCSGNLFWQEYIVDQPGYNLQAITFPQASADWGYVSGVIIFDTSTYGAGNALLGGPLSTPRDVKSGDQFIIPISGLSLQVL